MADEADVDVNEREALRAMLASDGWRIFTAMVAKEWGPAVVLRRIYAKEVSAEQIELSHKEVSRLMQLPAERILLLAPEKKSSNPLNALRRITR